MKSIVAAIDRLLEKARARVSMHAWEAHRRTIPAGELGGAFDTGKDDDARGGGMMLAELPVRWMLKVDQDGRPVLWHPRFGRRALTCVADQPRTVRRLLDHLERWIARAEVHYPIDDQALLAARFARTTLRQFAAHHLGVVQVA